MRGGRISTRTWAAIGSVAGLILLLLFMQGSLGGGKVGPEDKGPPGNAPASGAPVATVQRRTIDDSAEWPGAVRALLRAEIAPKVTARILEVRVRAGESVRRDDVLAVLDDRDVRARAEQARAGLDAARVEQKDAEADLGRMRRLVAEGVSPRQSLDDAEARFRTAGAEASRAGDALSEAEALLADTTIRAPFDGIVDERRSEPGDMTAPGRAIAVMHSPSHFQIEAAVPEGCARRLRAGMTLRVRLDEPDREVEARLEEIAPAADPKSHTVLVKAGLPAGAGALPGAFGRLIQTCDRRSAILIPAAAVTRSGQLELVRVLEDGRPRVRNVRTGKRHGDDVEVLSGLREGERVVLPGDAGD